MHILIGLVLGCVLLYFWLQGHWFARTLTFIGAAAILGVAGAAIGGEPPFVGSGDKSHAISAVFFVVGVLIAWPIASVPTWYHRRKPPVNA